MYIKIYIKLFSKKLYIVNENLTLQNIHYFIKKFINLKKFDLPEIYIYVKYGFLMVCV